MKRKSKNLCRKSFKRSQVIKASSSNLLMRTLPAQYDEGTVTIEGRTCFSLKEGVTITLENITHFSFAALSLTDVCLDFPESIPSME